MSVEDLEAVAVEAGLTGEGGPQFEDAPEAVAEDAEADPGKPEMISPEQLELMATGAVGAIGDILCRRARVTALEDDERRALGRAFANLAIVYDLGDKANPKVVAWAGVGLALGGVLSNRKPLYEPNEDDPDLEMATAEPMGEAGEDAGGYPANS